MLQYAALLYRNPNPVNILDLKLKTKAHSVVFSEFFRLPAKAGWSGSWL